MSFVPASALATLHGLVLAATTTKKTTGANYSLLIILALFLGAYLLFLRPRQQRMRQAQVQQRQADVGDEVVTTGGIVGRIRSFQDDRATLEIAPGTTIEILRAAVARRIDPPAYDQPNGADRVIDPDTGDTTPGSAEGSS